MNSVTTNGYNTAIGSNALELCTGGNNTAIGNNALLKTAAVNYNVGIGNSALRSNTTGINNTGIGRSTGFWKETGDNNVFIGDEAGYGIINYNTQENVLIGTRAGKLMQTGALNNTLIGYQAGDNITTGSDNIIIGHDVDPTTATNSELVIGGAIKSTNVNTQLIYLPDQTNFTGTLIFGDGGTNLSHAAANDGFYNIALGLDVFTDLTDGENNVGVGSSALANVTTGSFNIALGGSALQNTIITNNNTAIGYSALISNTDGASNTGIGRYAGYYKQTGNDNVFIGDSAGMGIAVFNTEKNVLGGKVAGNLMATGALNNILIGWQAGDLITTGNNNIIIGHDVDPTAATTNNELVIGGAIKSTNVNTRIIYLPEQATNFTGTLIFGDGGTSLSHTGGTEGFHNTALGLDVFTDLTDGENNTGIGSGALANVTTGNYNIAIGRNTLGVLTTTDSNTAIGTYALNLCTGTDNTAVGLYALYNTATVSNNVAVGANSLFSNTTGASNIGIGRYAGRYKQTGNDNVLIGDNAGAGSGAYNTEKNVVIGVSAGAIMATGALNNILIGWQAGNVITTGNNNIIIGHDQDPDTATTNSQLNIGGVITGDLTKGALGYGSETNANKRGQQTQASGKFATAGDAQGSNLIIRRSVTHANADWYELFLDGASEQLLIPTNTVWTFDILLIGTTVNQGKSWSYKIEGIIERDNANNTTLLASTVTDIYEADDVDFDARVTADDTNEALKIEVQDSSSGNDTVRWVAKVSTAEVSF